MVRSSLISLFFSPHSPYLLDFSAAIDTSYPILLDFSCGSDSKESTCNAGVLDLIPGSGRFPGEGNGNPLQQYSGLENFMDEEPGGL